jgi:hypothetical protein
LKENFKDLNLNLANSTLNRLRAKTGNGSNPIGQDVRLARAVKPINLVLKHFPTTLWKHRQDSTAIDKAILAGHLSGDANFQQRLDSFVVNDVIFRLRASSKIKKIGDGHVN